MRPTEQPTANTQHPFKVGLIAGNGKFPFLVLDGARKAGAEVAVAAIREETDPKIEKVANQITWVGVGQLGKMLKFFKNAGVEKAVMAGRGQKRQKFFARCRDLGAVAK